MLATFYPTETEQGKSTSSIRMNQLAGAKAKES
jgi:hypothetical protein